MTEPSIDERFAAALLGDPADTFRITIRVHAVVGEWLDELLSLAFITD
jgi:hypothetical protein